jgi:hypothetical protein
MKILVTCTVVFLVVSCAVTAAAQTKGWGLGAGAFDGDFGVQARKDFWLGGDVSQITGQASIYFPNRTTYRLDVDYHFVLNPANPGRFYPLAGLDFAFNSNSSGFGANAGGGFKFMFTDKLAGFAEAKYTFGSWDGFAFVGGIYF